MQHLPCWISQAKRNPTGGVIVSVFRSKKCRPGSGNLRGRPSFLSLLFLFSILALLFTGTNAHAAQVSLAWNEATGATGYKLYYGTASGNYAYYIDAGNATSKTLSDLSTGATYYFAATSYDSSGTQSGYSSEVSYTVPSACTYSISPAGVSVSASGTTGSITVTTQSGCAWTASSAASWMTITSGASGSGSGTVSYSVAANTATSSRTAASTVAGSSFTVTQVAAAAATPAAATSYAITASAGSGGSISPSGSVSVSKGASKTFTITPKSGYSVKSVTVDGVSKGALTSYTFSNVTAKHTISVTFKSKWQWW
jgi:hypothetical protein